MEGASAVFILSFEVALLYSWKGKRNVKMYFKKGYKIIYPVLVFGGVLSQYKPVEGSCFSVVIVVLGCLVWVFLSLGKNEK